MNKTERAAKIDELRSTGFEPPFWCSFACPQSNQDNAQHAACLAVNGVYCLILEEVMEKGAPCRARRMLKQNEIEE